MSRIYRKENYGGSFRGSIRGGSFNPVQAYDPSKKIKEETNKKIEDIRTLQRSAKRQANVDQAVFNADVAQSNANMKAFQGLLSLSQTALKTFDEVSQQREKDEWNKQIEDTFFGDLDSFEIGEDQTSEPADTSNEALQASEKAIQEVGGEDETLKDSLRAPQINTISAIQDQKQNVYQKAIGLPSVMSEWMESDIRVTLPDGRVVTPATVNSQEELNYVIRAGFAKWAKENDWTSLTKKEKSKILPVVKQLQQNISSQLGAQISANRKEAAVTKSIETLKMGLEAGDADLNASYQSLYTGLLASGAYRGNQGKAADDAFNELVKHAIETEDQDLLDKIKLIERVPGNKGTTFGKIKADEIEDASLKIAASETNTYKIISAQSAVEVKKILDKRLEELGTDGVKDSDVNAKAIAALEKIPTAQAQDQAIQLRNLGLNYNPNTFGQMKLARENGATYSDKELALLVSNNDLTKQEARDLGWTGTGSSVDEQALARIEKADLDSVIKGKANGLVDIFLKEGKATDVEVRLARDSSGKTLQNDLTERLTNDLLEYLRDNPDASNVDLRKEIDRIGKEYQENNSHVKYDPYSQTFLGYEMGGVQTVTNAQGIQVRNLINAASVNDRIEAGLVDPNKDLLLDKAEMEILQNVIYGKTNHMSTDLERKVELYAKHFGTNKETLFKAQMKAYGVPLPPPPKKPEPKEITEEIASQYTTDQLSELSTQALGYKLQPRHFNNPKYTEQKNIVIQYILANQ